MFAFLGGLPEEVLLGWAWRVPFLSSIVLILVALFTRMRLKETPTFVELEKHEQVSEHPFSELTRNSLGSVLRGIGLRMGENGGSYLFNSVAVAFAVGTVGVSKTIGPTAVAVASLIGMISVPLTGWISDRVGRVPVYRFGAVVLVLLAFPGWWLISLGNPVLVIVVISIAIGFGVNSMLGAQCALLPEMFLAWLSGHQDGFTMVGGLQSARSPVHLARVFELANAVRLLPDPELAVHRLGLVLDAAGFDMAGFDR